MRRVFWLDVSMSLIFYAMLVGSVYLLFAGHNRPGGGFVGGLLAGAAVALRYVAGGIDEVRRVSPVKPWTLLGTGVLVTAATAVTPILLGDTVLDNAYVEFDVAGLGHVALTSGTIFDLGVYLVVVGVLLMVVEAFGERFDPVNDQLEGKP